MLAFLSEHCNYRATNERQWVMPNWTCLKVSQYCLAVIISEDIAGNPLTLDSELHFWDFISLCKDKGNWTDTSMQQLTTLLLVTGLVWALTLTCVSASNVTLDYQILSRLYVPYTYEPEPTYALGEESVEQLAYDKDAQLVYTGGTSLFLFLRSANVHVILYVEISMRRTRGGYEWVICALNKEEGRTFYIYFSSWSNE